MALPRVSMVQYLLQKGFLKQEQLEEAQKVAKQTNQTDIGKVLQSMKLVGERELLQAKAQEAGMAFADLDRVQIDSSAINVVPDRIVKQHNAIPVRKDGQTLWVAMSKPGDIMAMDDFKMASGCRVIPVVAVPAAIDDAIKKYYGGGVAGPTNSTPEPQTAAAPAMAAGAMREDARRAMAEASVAKTKDEDLGAGADDDKLADQAPIIRLANALIQQAIQDRASDIHVEPQQRSVRVPLPRGRRARGGDDRAAQSYGGAHLAPEDHGRYEYRRAPHPAGRSHRGAAQREGVRPSRVVRSHAVR